MQKLFETQQFILADFKQLPYYDRLHYQTIRCANRINGIVGPRGTGKTTFLLQHADSHGALERKALYVTADNIFFLDHSLWELAEWIYKSTDVEFLYIDEIHKYPNWNQELKNIYDTFAKLNVMFSGSSMIDIVRSKYDLSRRVSLYPMHGFSFREYLDFYHDIKIPVVSLTDLCDQHVKIASSIQADKLLKLFKEYLKLGYYPFTKTLGYDTERYQGIENIIQKTIYEDIATLHNLKTASLLIIEKLYKYIGSSSAGELNVNKLASHVQKDFKDVSKYLSFLEQAGLIKQLYTKQSGKAVLGTPNKLLPDNSNMIYALDVPNTQDNLIGKARETFFVNQLNNADCKVYCTKVGDYQVDHYHFEIGGKNKSTKQLKGADHSFVLADDILIGHNRTIPLYLMGFLY